jgi:F-type H+-transporting ATPase subunit b
MMLLKDPEFWVLIAFVIAFAFMAWKATPLLTGALDQRAARIKAELDEAQRLRDDAMRALADYRQKQQAALGEAAEIVSHARAEAERAAAAGERELEAALERRRRMASEKVALEEAKAIAAVRIEAVEVAIAAVRRALAEGLDAPRRAGILDEAIAALPQALHS